MVTTASLQNVSNGESRSPFILPMDVAARGQDTSQTTDSATISSNDFLTLLVTEMQNQDPTASTDPNEYINQLVNVNSLQQLISINQTLSGDLSQSVPKSDDQKSARPQLLTGGENAPTAPSSPIHSFNQAGRSSIGFSIGREHISEPTLGNLAIPHAKPAATAVARSLGERAQFKK